MWTHALFIILIAYFLGSSLMEIWKLIKARARESKVPLATQGRDTFVFGCILGALTFYFSWSVTPWSYLLCGVCSGMALGIIFGLHSTARWEQEILVEGYLSARVKVAWHAWVIFAIWFILTLVFGSRVLTTLGHLAHWTDSAIAAGCIGLAFFFVASGVYMWFWARQMGNQGFRV